MRRDVENATARIIAIRSRLRDGDVSDSENDDALSEGYARALAGDAWLARAEQRLHELIDDTTLPVRGRDLRTLVRDHAELQRDVIALRHELEGLRRDRERAHERSKTRVP
jgi:hypothetical protein